MSEPADEPRWDVPLLRWRPSQIFAIGVIVTLVCKGLAALLMLDLQHGRDGVVSVVSALGALGEVGFYLILWALVRLGADAVRSLGGKR